MELNGKHRKHSKNLQNQADVQSAAELEHREKRKNLKVLIVGCGGREHVLAWKCLQSPLVDEVYCAPGNPGMGTEVTTVAIGVDDIEALVAFAGEGETLRGYRAALAAREGPIVPLVSEVDHPAAYAHERAVCVDTTAAGGNASLLAAS